MTRTEIINDYQVDSNGVIRRPGKFEGEPLYVPYFWERGTEGFADLDENGVFGFEVLNADTVIFPELEGINTLALEKSDSGFVHSVEYQSLAILERELAVHAEQIEEQLEELKEMEEEEN